MGPVSEPHADVQDVEHERRQRRKLWADFESGVRSIVMWPRQVSLLDILNFPRSCNSYTLNRADTRWNDGGVTRWATGWVYLFGWSSHSSQLDGHFRRRHKRFDGAKLLPVSIGDSCVYRATAGVSPPEEGVVQVFLDQMFAQGVMMKQCNCDEGVFCKDCGGLGCIKR